MSLFGRAFSVFSPGNRGGTIAPQPIILATAGLRVASVDYNNAELIAGTDKTIVAAVPGFWINPIMWTAEKNIPVTPYAPTNVGFNLCYAGDTGQTRLTALTPVVTSAGTRVDRATSVTGTALSPVTLCVNKALVVHPGSGNGGGAAANKMRFTVVYQLVPITT